jgi:hypothetical protein
MIGVIIALLIGTVLVINFITRPTPEHKRNITYTDAKITVEFSDLKEVRKPIIRTYKLEEYNSFDGKDFEKTMSEISGNVEGDIPAVYLKDNNNLIHVKFFKNENRVEPDILPDIEIETPEEYADTAPYNPLDSKVIKDKLEKTEEEYSYKLKNYRTQYEKYFLYYNIIKIHYKIDGEDYISVLGLNATNTDDGTNFFENEELNESIEPEL